jgi:tetratricopeptide (TPR) repeat protein
LKYCHQCGYKLSLGIEKFCPNCGKNLTQEKKEGTNEIGITNTRGDVIGAGVEGTGHFIGKEIGYTVNRNVIHLNISSGNISKEVIYNLQKIMSAPTQIEHKSLIKDTESDKDIKNKIDGINKTQKQIRSIRQEVDNIEKREGIPPIEVIKAENIQISRKELLLKEHILKGNEYFYKEEYNKAIQCYDRALEIEPNNADIWNNKGHALDDLGNHEEAIQCYDKALELDSNHAIAWNNKGFALAKLGKYNEAIQCYDKTLELDSNHAIAWNNKGFALGYPTAIARAWNNKGLALENLGNHEEALQCYDKALELDPNNQLFHIYRKRALRKLKAEKKSNWKDSLENKKEV